MRYILPLSILFLNFCEPSYAATANVSFSGIVPVKACSLDQFTTLEEIRNSINKECALQIRLQTKYPTVQTIEKTLTMVKPDTKIEDLIIVEYR